MFDGEEPTATDFAVRPSRPKVGAAAPQAKHRLLIFNSGRIDNVALLAEAVRGKDALCGGRAS